MDDFKYFRREIDIFNKLNIQGRIDHQIREVLFEKAPFLVKLGDDELKVRKGLPRDIYETDPFKEDFIEHGFYVVMEGHLAGTPISVNDVTKVS